MITKKEILQKINLSELIGTQFEDRISIKKLTKGSSIYYEKFEKFQTYFLIKGKTQHVIYTPEGGEFYRNFFEGDIPGLSFSLSNKNSPERFRPFDVDVIALENSIVAYIPFEEILELNFEKKVIVLEKLINMEVEDHFKEFNHLLLKSIYSDEEFFINFLEKNEVLNMGSTVEISKHLNINLRTLQRLLKKLLDQEIIDKKEARISIKNKMKLEQYKEKFYK